MKIAVLNLTSGGLSGGYRKYLLKLAPILNSDPIVTRTVFFVHEALRQTKGLEGLQIQTWPARDHLFGYRQLKASLRELAPDVIFIPSARWIRVDRIPTVIMVRNMEPLEVPFGQNPLIEKLKNIGRAWEARSACCKATRIIAVSQHVKNFLVNRWTISPDKVDLIYHGIDAPMSASAEKKPAKLDGFPEKFIFTAGSIRPARGLEDLVVALGILARNGRRCTAVIAGGMDAGMDLYKQKLDAMAREAGVEKQIVWPGALSPAEMAWCYNRCEYFVMTTHAEACPNTALEAMSHGCCCVVTDKEPLPEFFQDTAWYYRARNGASLAEQLLKAFDSTTETLQRIQSAARHRASEFKWEDTARLTIAKLAQAVSSSAVESIKGQAAGQSS
jgi:glycosyltransferase involved in cell wall biosynthesis